MRRRAFTLVELLIVVGLIAVLLSLLLPAVNRARQMAAQAGCAGNMRQIGMALTLYAQDNDGFFPRCAQIGGFQRGDWIDWWPGDNLQRSAVARYMGDHVQPRYFRCPSDIIENHTRILDGIYAYSYTLNNYVAADAFWAAPPLTPIRNFAITHQNDRILLVDEDESSADDGNYLPEYAPYPNLLAVRHDLNRRSRTSSSFNLDLYRRGNVLMVDGHVDFVDRAWMRVVSHYDPRAR